MLRISQLRHGSQVTVKLEGRLLEPWLDELRRSLPADDGATVLSFDLAGLTFADAAGRAFLGTLIHDGARLIACSNFLAELLKPQNH